MVSGKIVVLAGLLSTATAQYYCMTSGAGGRNFQITDAQASAAMSAGGTTTGISGYPHEFGGITGGSTRAMFYGADPRCNQVQPDPPLLLEFPVFSDGTIYDKNVKKGGEGTPTPARVVYVNDLSALCGVMTHVVEAADHTGSGDFRVCDR